jgi:hypothetical protein
VRYEITRAIIDERGLLTVHLNSINHHKTLTPHPRGHNPLTYMAVGKVREVGRPLRYCLFERKPAQKFVNGQWIHWQWERYQDYTDPVKLPPWLTDPAPAMGNVPSLVENGEAVAAVVNLCGLGFLSKVAVV